MSTSKSAEWYRRVYRDLSTSGIVAAATAGAGNVCVAPDAKYTIFVQSITVTIKTAAAQTITFQDDSGTIQATIIEASAAAATIRTVDFGAKGLALTVAESLDIVNTAGPAYAYAIQAYARQTVVAQSTTVNRIF